MKNKIKYFLLLGALFLFFQKSYAQTSASDEYNQILKISPVELARSQFQIGYERYFQDKTRSVVILPSFILKRSNYENSDGGELGLQYRIYLSQNDGGVFHHIGFYSGVYGVGLVLKEEFTLFRYTPTNPNGIPYTATNKVNSIEGGVLLGIQVDVTERIVLDFFVGGGLRYSGVKDERIEMENFFTDYGVFD